MVSATKVIGFPRYHPAALIGSFDGQEFAISDLVMNRPNRRWLGLFGFSIGTIRNVRLADVDIKGRNTVGGLVGRNAGTITHCSVSGAVTIGKGVTTRPSAYT